MATWSGVRALPETFLFLMALVMVGVSLTTGNGLIRWTAIAVAAVALALGVRRWRARRSS